jgi:hypothetical protein
VPGRHIYGEGERTIPTVAEIEGKKKDARAAEEQALALIEQEQLAAAEEIEGKKPKKVKVVDAVLQMWARTKKSPKAIMRMSPATVQEMAAQGFILAVAKAKKGSMAYIKAVEALTAKLDGKDVADVQAANERAAVLLIDRLTKETGLTVGNQTKTTTTTNTQVALGLPIAEGEQEYVGEREDEA